MRPVNELPKKPTAGQVANLAANCKHTSEQLRAMIDALRLHSIDVESANALQREALMLVRDSSQLALSLRPSIAQLPLPLGRMQR